MKYLPHTLAIFIILFFIVLNDAKAQAINDACADALPVSCGVLIVGTNDDATDDNPPVCGGLNNYYNGVWYAFTGTGELVNFSTCSPSTTFDTQIGVFTGLCNELVCVNGINDSPICQSSAQITISTEVGVVYYILISGASANNTGVYELRVTCPPDSEDPDSPRSLSCNNSPSGFTLAASPPPMGLLDCGLTYGTGGAVWYELEGNGSCVELNTCSVETNFNTQITVFRITPNGPVCETSNDDANDPNCNYGHPGISSVEIATLPEVTYLIMVHGVGSAEGFFRLNINCTTPPLEVTCPPDLTLECNQAIPPPATTVAEFEAQGGSISGGSCIMADSIYTITPDSFIESEPCTFSIFTRNYTITNTFTEQETQCTQLILIPPEIELVVSCMPDETVSCEEDISVSEMDFEVDLFCPYTVEITGPVIDNGKPGCPGTTYTYTYTAIPEFCGVPQSCKRTFTIVNDEVPTITCPADITVNCEDEANLDPNDAVVTTACDAGYTVYIRNPGYWGVPGCSGTMYKYEYVVVDACGRRASCTQLVTIENDPASIDVPTGATVACLEDIDISVEDATVNNSCADYNLYLTSPEINGPAGCPGTTYTYTYRLIDACGNTVEEPVVYTLANNPPPSIEAPADLTFSCLAGINPNPSQAIISTACSSGFNVSVDGPQTIGALDCPGTRYIYTYTVTDECGRSASDTQTFTVQNDGPIFINCPNDNWLQLNCEDYGGEDGTIAVVEAWIASVSAQSSCGGILNVANDFNPNNFGTCINNGFTTVTFFATDACGRTTTCQGIVVVTDTEGPVFLEAAQNHWEICNYNSPQNFQDWVDNHGGAVAFDECAGDNISWSTIPANPGFSCDGAGNLTEMSVTFVATDNCGNFETTSATFYAFVNQGHIADPSNEHLPQMDESLTVLEQNYPNPFSVSTIIRFYLPEADLASLKIYDFQGKLLKNISQQYEKGFHELSLTKEELGSTGILYYQLSTSNLTTSRSMLIME